MGDFFADLRSGVQFPQVIMNQGGPLPGSGGLPRPLHDTADARINYNSTLLGNLSPYAYGEPGYLSSQTAYLNIPHKIQKFVPIVYLPEARPGATEFFDLPHPVDDGDLVFTLRLDRNSLFCTGLKHGDTRRVSTGTAVDPLINLATVNYILSGVQLGVSTPANVGGAWSGGDLWSELLFNLDRNRFGRRMGMNGRDYRQSPLLLSDIVHIVRHCIRPFGIARGSEKQGGQNEATLSPATWPVGFVISVTIDGKESNVMNLWHHTDLSAGDDLVLALKLMPLRPYTLNHYYKSVKRQNWFFQDDVSSKERYVWQLVPAIAHMDMPTKEEQIVIAGRMGSIEKHFTCLAPYPGKRGTAVDGLTYGEIVNAETPWQELGYWHIGRTQIMTSKYGVEEYWHNDMANSLRTNHLDITLQPFFTVPPSARKAGKVLRVINAGMQQVSSRDPGEDRWQPKLCLEQCRWDRRVVPRALSSRPGPVAGENNDPIASSAPIASTGDHVLDSGRGERADDDGGWEKELGLGGGGVDLLRQPPPEVDASDSLLSFMDDDDLDRVSAAPSGVSHLSEDSSSVGGGGNTLEPPVQALAEAGLTASGSARKGAGGKKKAAAKPGGVVGGSLLRADGTSEGSLVSML
jgi:hypothetical protein